MSPTEAGIVAIFAALAALCAYWTIGAVTVLQPRFSIFFAAFLSFLVWGTLAWVLSRFGAQVWERLGLGPGAEIDFFDLEYAAGELSMAGKLVLFAAAHLVALGARFMLRRQVSAPSRDASL